MSSTVCPICCKAIDGERVVSVRIAHPQDGPKKDYYCSVGCAAKALGAEVKPGAGPKTEPRTTRRTRKS